MKFLLDQDVPEDLTYLLRELNHEVLRLRDVLPPEAADSAVLKFADEHDCLVMTCNRDDFIKLAETQHHHRHHQTQDSSCGTSGAAATARAGR